MEISMRPWAWGANIGVSIAIPILAIGAVSIRNDPYAYSAEYTDSESGLQYLQARYYNPGLMRFATRDNYVLMNRYGYGDDNPIMEGDPTGHMGWFATFTQS